MSHMTCIKRKKKEKKKKRNPYYPITICNICEKLSNHVLQFEARQDTQPTPNDIKNIMEQNNFTNQSLKTFGNQLTRIESSQQKKTNKNRKSSQKRINFIILAKLQCQSLKFAYYAFLIFEILSERYWFYSF